MYPLELNVHGTKNIFATFMISNKQTYFVEMVTVT